MQTFFNNILVLIIGWGIGALINYLSEVLPYRRRIVKPFCLSCAEEQPIVRYFLWPRTCSSCGKERSRSTWIVEAIAAGLTLWLWNAPPEQLGFAGGLLLLAYFGVVVVIDLKYRLILHPVSLVGVAIGLVIGISLHGIWKTLLGGAVGYGVMYAFYALGLVFSRWMARRRGQEVGEEALGFGDVNLSGVLGLILGWPLILPGLMLAVLIGGLFSIIYIAVMMAARRYRLLMAIPYGPFLIGGAVLLLYFSGFVRTLLAP